MEGKSKAIFYFQNHETDKKVLVIICIVKFAQKNSKNELVLLTIMGPFRMVIFQSMIERRRHGGGYSGF